MFPRLKTNTGQLNFIDFLFFVNLLFCHSLMIEKLGKETQVRPSVPIFNETILDLPLLLMAKTESL